MIDFIAKRSLFLLALILFLLVTHRSKHLGYKLNILHQFFQDFNLSCILFKSVSRLVFKCSLKCSELNIFKLLIISVKHQ